MTQEPDRPLHTDIQALCQDMQLTGAQIQLPEERLVFWARKLGELPVATRKQRALELIVVARRFAEQGGEASGIAIAQISALIVQLMGSEQAVRDLVDGSDVDAGTASKLLGQSKAAFELKDQQAAAPGGGMLGMLSKKSDK